jgi:citrate synthase
VTQRCNLQTQEIRGALRRDGRQHGAVHGGPQRQRSALSRLRHSRYRGRTCEFEEIAHLLVHEVLPNKSQELAAYKAKLKSLRSLPKQVLRPCSSSCRPTAHPMDVLRTGVSRCSAVCRPKRVIINAEGARDLADRLMASLGSMLCYWHHFANGGQAHRGRDRR